MMATMSALASLQVSARWSHRRLTDVCIRNTRPAATRLLIGRPAHQAVALVPRLFSLCGHAHGLAAGAALAAATTADCVPHPELRATLALTAETLREHLGKLLLDWPRLFNRPAAESAYAKLYRQLNRTDWTSHEALAVGDAILVQMQKSFPTVSGAPVEDEQGGPSRGLIEAISLGYELVHAPATRPIPSAQPASAWAKQIDTLFQPGFAQKPHRDGMPCETGALIRQADVEVVARLLHHGNRVGARVLARLVEVFAGAHALRAPLDQPATSLDAAVADDGSGVATVETARGLLLHALRLDKGRIADYVIIAPTDWNLHPQGVLAQEAAGCSTETASRALLMLNALVLALDPCMEFHVSLRSDQDA